MISFMVLGGPRSATTWMANLLTTDHTVCFHDPLLTFTLPQLSGIEIPGKKVGISCTSVSLYVDWVNSQRCPKIVLYREPHEINQSLQALGLIQLDSGKYFRRLDSIQGSHMFQWDSVFRPQVAQKICGLAGVPFCPHRFHQLRQMNIQPQFNRLAISKDAVQELVRRINEEGV